MAKIISEILKFHRKSLLRTGSFGFLSSRLLCFGFSWLLLLFLNFGNLERSGSALAFGLDEDFLLDEVLQALFDEWSQLDGVGLVVGCDVLLDGGQGRAYKRK